MSCGGLRNVNLSAMVIEAEKDVDESNSWVEEAIRDRSQR
jgi:hypothetical protein